MRQSIIVLYITYDSHSIYLLQTRR